MRPTLAFLQARMGSTRLPGKVLLRIRGQSILERSVRRLRGAGSIQQVVVLTTTLAEDDQVVEEALRLGAWIHRGPEQDVLKRFQQASERYLPGIVVRATGDNPLIDIGSVDRIVRAIRGSHLEYCMESGLPVGAATEAITADALARVDRIAVEPHHREHVTLYVKDHPDEFRMALLSPPDCLCRPDMRITVDTPEDFIAVEDLIESLPEQARPLPLRAYLEVVPG
ncbi:MAG TPA: NTP transferase domain-containing protein [Acidobacteriota bacterium]|nr:NTP transferase domain-containing protein [Acidobacteriota bacterium]